MFNKSLTNASRGIEVENERDLVGNVPVQNLKDELTVCFPSPL